MSNKRKRKPLPSRATAKVNRLTHEGRGIASVNDKTTFIFNALPGETVEFDYNQCHGKYDEGSAVTIVAAAPNRVVAKCPHFGLCGGCNLQHLSSAAQIEFKQQMLLEQLQHFGKLTPKTILPPTTGDVWGYRHKARLGVRDVIKKSTVLVGFRERQSPYLSVMEQCEVLHPSVGRLIMPLRDLIASLHARQQIAQIEVAIGDNVTALVFRNLIELDDHDKQLLSQFAEQHQLWLYLQPGKADSVTKLFPADEQLFLSYSLTELTNRGHALRPLTLQFHPLDFTQVNPSINTKMINQALKMLNLQPTDTVLDLFCGLGNFTLPMAQLAHQVVGVEGAEEMTVRARMNADLNQLQNVEFHAANLAVDCSQQPWAKQKFNKILIDPPRSGAIELLPLLASFKADIIVYVSCNPATLARDAGELVQKYGYTLQEAGVLDMFPQTAHVESIALFTR